MRLKLVHSILAIGILLCTHNSLVSAAAQGTATGESSDEKGQQGLGLGSESHSSNVIMGGPDIVVGEVTKIQGEQFLIKGDRGQEISLRVTKDTNKVCGDGQGTKVLEWTRGGERTSRDSSDPFHGEASRKEWKGVIRARNDAAVTRRQHAEGNRGPIHDPSKLKEVVGTTDPKAREDVAKGSAFVVGGGDCKFKEGDQVRIEASDMGIATTIKQLQSSKR